MKVTNMEENSSKVYYFVRTIIEVQELPLSYFKSEVAQCLNVYSTCEWKLRRFVDFYRLIYSITGYEIQSYKADTFYEFDNYVLHSYRIKIDKDDDEVECETMPNDMGVLYSTGSIRELYHNWKIDNYSDWFGFPTIIETAFISSMLEGIDIMTKYLKPDSDIYEPIKRMLTRTSGIYAIIFILASTRNEEMWFDELSDYMKIDLTKRANFPKLLEELYYWDLISSEYAFYYWLRIECGIFELTEKEEQDLKNLREETLTVDS